MDDDIPLPDRNSFNEKDNEKRISLGCSSILQSSGLQRAICWHNALHKVLLDYVVYFLRLVYKSFSILYIS